MTRQMDIGPVVSSLWSNDFQPFLNLFDETMNKLHVMSNDASNELSSSRTPSFDVKETKDAYIVEGDLPGVEQNDISIEFVDNSTLTIRACTEQVHEEGTKPDANGTGQVTSGALKDSKGTAAEAMSGSIIEAGDQALLPADQSHQPTYWVRERRVGQFQRSIYFPTNIDREDVKANLKNGVLSVTVPKTSQTEKKPKKIEIDSE